MSKNLNFYRFESETIKKFGCENWAVLKVNKFSIFEEAVGHFRHPLASNKDQKAKVLKVFLCHETCDFWEERLSLFYPVSASLQRALHFQNRKLFPSLNELKNQQMREPTKPPRNLRIKN